MKKVTWVVEYTCPNSPLKPKQKEFEVAIDACLWIAKFRIEYGPNWKAEILKKENMIFLKWSRDL